MTLARRLAALALGAVASAAIAGCGGGATTSTTTLTSTTSTTSEPVTMTATTTSQRRTSPATNTQATRPRRPSVTTATSTSTSTTTTTTTSAPTTTTTIAATTTTTSTTTATATRTATSAQTRTETGPAFVQTTPASAPGAALAAAIAVLAHHGYAPVENASYDAQDTLRVLVGARRDGRMPGEHAFFFNETTYLGTDASAPSAAITVLAHSDSEVTLGYAVGGSVRAVQFALNMGAVMPLSPLPSAAARA